MVEQYPHLLRFNELSGPPVQDAEGNWVAPPSFEFPHELRCRAEPASAGAEITGTDGARVAYAFTVYIPTGSEVIRFGQLLSLYNESGELIAELPAKQFSKGQLNRRIWV